MPVSLIFKSYILASDLSQICSITKSLNVNDSFFKQAAVWSPWRDVTSKFL